ncbi:MAG TPA: hypothetical protein VNQ50_00380 [Xanthobacteraceae bacterium]|jgi:hypothetical protein|nr:hypothetical protein [Xanthobacteraceae bacterium]
MRLMAIAIAAAFAVSAVSVADAAPRKSKSRTVATAATTGAGSTVFTSRDENGRTRTRIIVQKRSYLDGGTEVMPGDINRNYIATPMHRASDMLGPNDITNPVGPIPDPFFLPGKDNPWPGFQY